MKQSVGLSNFKSICIIIVVVGCFAVLWPKIFYPMLLYGLNWDSKKGSYLSEYNVNEHILPPKIREAMRSSPIKNPSNIQKLPGRPQFYTGKREISTGSSQNSVWNVFVPIYALALVVIFLYALFKLSLKSDDGKVDQHVKPRPSSLHNPEDCKECHYDLLRREYTNKRYDPFLSRSSYRTFDYYGRRNVSQVMRSLVNDVKKFREQLIKAEICRCKLEKYEKEFNEAENFLNQIDKNECNLKKEDKERESDNSISPEKQENNNSDDVEKTSLIDQLSDEKNKVEDSVEDKNNHNEEAESEQNENENKENILASEKLPPIVEEVPRIKQRRNYLKLKSSKNDILKDKTNVQEAKRIGTPFELKLVHRINHKLDKIIHLKQK